MTLRFSKKSLLKMAWLGAYIGAGVVQAFPFDSTSAGGHATGAGFGPTQVFGLSYASDVQISPDGKRVAYVCVSQDMMNDRPETQVWLADIRSGQLHPLGVKGSFSPRWSPDSTRLAFLAPSKDRVTSLQVERLETGQRVVLLHGQDAINEVRWSPDGKEIAFAKFVRGESPVVSVGLARPVGAQWAEPIKIISRLDWQSDGSGQVPAGHQHLFRISADGGIARQVTNGNFDEGELDWSHDGRRIYFSSNRENPEVSAGNTEIYSADLSSGSEVKLTHRNGPDAEPAESPDGRWIAYVGYDERFLGYQNHRLLIMRTDGRDAHILAADLDQDVGDPQWSADSKSIYIDYIEHGGTHIAQVSLDGRWRPVATGLMDTTILDRPYAGGTFTTSHNGAIAYAGNVRARPPEVVVAEKSGLHVLTDLNQRLFAHISLADPTPLAVHSSFDNRSVQSWLMLPPSARPGQKFPLILEIHGGPNAAYGPSWSTSDQLFVAAGYAVVYANPRGSASYGEEFANLIQQKFPSHDFDDLMSVVDAAIRTGYVDANNLFVTGGSGGGLLTAWIVGKTHRFRAALAQKPVIDWFSQSLTTDLPAYHVTHLFSNPPWKDPAPYWLHSPLSLVGNVSTPTALLVGEEDKRTPVNEAVQYYSALKLRGVPSELILVPGASHHSLNARPSQLIQQVNATLEWFSRFRKSG